jgi:hypothetical protein
MPGEPTSREPSAVAGELLRRLTLGLATRFMPLFAKHGAR